VGTVRLQVADLDRSLAYYERVIGLGVLDRSEGAAQLGAEPGRPLIELRQRPGARPVPRRGRLGLYHFAILLPERAALGRFVRHLGELDVPAGMSDHLVSEAIYLSDPDGLGIEVYADRPRDRWEYQGGQIVMATNPLDVSDLLAAAGESTWTGAPPGTLIGHIHLFVGDLERSAAFYERGIGFDRTVWSYPGALFMSAGGYHHHLGTNTWAAGAPPAAEADARLLEWELLVPGTRDAAHALERLAAAGAPVQREAGVARDPWGTAVRIRPG
jgi:catechol 2,3-dioxygenase